MILHSEVPEFPLKPAAQGITPVGRGKYASLLKSSLPFCQNVSSRCAKEEGIRDVWIKPFVELSPSEFSLYFHITGKHRGFHLDWHKNSNCLQGILTLTNHSISSLLL